MVKTSIIIPVFKETVELSATLNSLEEQAAAQGAEIVVVADGSRETIEPVVAGRRVRLAALPDNRGSYAARNLGVEVASGDYLLFIDAGNVASPTWVAQMVAELASYDYVAGDVRFPASTADPDFAQSFQLMYGFPIGVFLNKAGYGPTANLGVRREVFARYGGFDGRLRSGGDLEFGRRLPTSLVRKHFAKEAFVHHPYRTWDELVRKHRRVLAGVRQVLSKRFGGGRLGDARSLIKLTIAVTVPRPRKGHRYECGQLGIRPRAKAVLASWLLGYLALPGLYSRRALTVERDRIDDARRLPVSSW